MFEFLLFILLDVYIDVKPLDHTINFVTFLMSWHSVLHYGYTIYSPTNNAKRFSIFTKSLPHIIMLFFFFDLSCLAVIRIKLKNLTSKVCDLCPSAIIVLLRRITQLVLWTSRFYICRFSTQGVRTHYFLLSSFPKQHRITTNIALILFYIF